MIKTALPNFDEGRLNYQYISWNNEGTLLHKYIREGEMVMLVKNAK